MGERTASGRYDYRYDGQGNTLALTDSAGTVVDSDQYDPYGNAVASTGTVANAYRYGGAYGAYTDSSGLLKIGQRYDDPSVARWTQPDPLGGNLARPLSLDRYAYASSCPVNRVDPSGMDDSVDWGCVGDGVALLASIGLLFASGGWVLIAGGAVWVYEYERYYHLCKDRLGPDYPITT